jgi:hypothetical protein
MSFSPLMAHEYSSSLDVNLCAVLSLKQASKYICSALHGILSFVIYPALCVVQTPE